MKKTKNLLLLAVMFVSIFVFAGIVKAAPWGFQEAWLVCNPEAVDPGEQTTCYYFGKVQGTGTTANAGFYTEMYTTDNLILDDVKPNESLENAYGLLVKMSGTTEASIQHDANKMPEKLANFKCKVQTDKDTKSRGCGVFYTQKGQNAAYDVAKMKVYGKLTESDLTQSSYAVDTTAVLGEILVHLDNKNDVDKCGNLCISSVAVEKAEDWAHANCTAAGQTGWDNTTCDDDGLASRTKSHHIPDGFFDCFEIEMKVKEEQNNEETGAFVSYAILAAGALIAISAVTIAKKHNRLQKI